MDRKAAKRSRSRLRKQHKVRIKERSGRIFYDQGIPDDGYQAHQVCAQLHPQLPVSAAQWAGRGAAQAQEERNDLCGELDEAKDLP